MPKPADKPERPARRSIPGRTVAVLLGALWLAGWLAGGTEADRTVLISAYAGERSWLLASLWVTRLGDWEVLVALTLFASGWLLLRRQGRLALLLIGVTFVARLLVALQKILLGRIRPAENEHLVQVQSLSFPSGHAANSMVVYVMFALVLARDGPQRRLAVAAAIILSVLVGISRVTLGVHWPSDVVGGWAFGALWVMLVWHAKDRSLARFTPGSTRSG